MSNKLHRFVEESNRIEGITRPPTDDELEVSRDFLTLSTVRVGDLERFVSACQRGATIRARPGMDVRVGNHRPPRGGTEIAPALEAILVRANSNADPFATHLEYETLHPFMDGNGRSGRILWAWMMLRSGTWPGIALGFLHAWYYQSLSHDRGTR